MIDIPREIRLRFDARLIKEPIPEQFYHFYRRWLRFYFDYCGKYQHDAYRRESLSHFLEKLIEKKTVRPAAKTGSPCHFAFLWQLLWRRASRADFAALESQPTPLNTSDGGKR